MKNDLKRMLKGILAGILIYLTSPAWIWVLLVAAKIIGSMAALAVVGIVMVLILVAVVVAARPAKRRRTTNQETVDATL